MVRDKIHIYIYTYKTKQEHTIYHLLVEPEADVPCHLLILLACRDAPRDLADHAFPFVCCMSYDLYVCIYVI